jgi:AbrB family looped-hinge helix DNA binding protein
MSFSTVTQKGQVTIPKVIRDRLGVKEGEKVLFVLRGEEVVLKVIRGNILDLKASVKAQAHPENFEAIRKSVKRFVSNRVARRE